jgi:hypothetical protein
VTAIREGDTDGNDATVGDPNWNSQQNTLSVSDYPSTMSLISGAAAATLAGVLGIDQVPFSGGVGVPLPTISVAIGGFEMLLGVLCLEVNVVAFFFFVCGWKLGTELLHVPGQAYGAWWEVLERGSSYAAPLLWIGVQQVLTAHGVTAQGLIPGG